MDYKGNWKSPIPNHSCSIETRSCRVYRGERRIPASGEGRDYVSAYKEPIYEDGKESRAVCDNCQFESSWSQHAEDIARAARYHEAWAATYDGYCPEYGMPRASKGTP